MLTQKMRRSACVAMAHVALSVGRQRTWTDVNVSCPNERAGVSTVQVEENHQETRGQQMESDKS